MRHILVIPIVIVLLAGLVPASAGQIATYTVPFIYELSKTVSIDPASPNATANFALLYSNPQKVIVEYNLTTSDANGTVTIALKSGNGATLKTVSLSSGGANTIPLSGTDVGDSLVVTLSGTNLSTVWSGTIKVVVYDPIKFDVSVSPSTISVPKGGKANLDISLRQNSGPPGKVTFKTTFTYNGNPTSYLSGYALTPYISTTGAGWSGSSTIEIKAKDSAPSGQYTGEITVYFTSGVSSELQQGVEIAKITMGVDLADGIPGGGALSDIGNNKTALYAGAIVLILFLVLVFAMNSGRRR